MRVMHIEFEHTDDFFARVKEDLKQKRRVIQPKDVVRFSTVSAYQQFMSEQKYAILAAIYNHKPNSIYQLAQLVDRDLANVKRDCDALAIGRFIVLKPGKDKRNTLIPRLAFNYDAVVVHMPEFTYSHLLSGDVA